MKLDFSILLAIALMISGTSASADLRNEGNVIRVGVLACDDIHDAAARSRSWINKLDKHPGPRVKFRIAMGTYDEIERWLARDEIDIAIANPGILSGALTRMKGTHAALEYLASVLVPPSASPFAGPARRDKIPDTEYHSIAIVPAGSPIANIDDMRAAYARGDVEFLFVHPLSVSGGIAPLEALRKIGIIPKRDEILFTWSHDAVFRLVCEPSRRKYRVAFTWDGAIPAREYPVKLMPFPELEALSIPPDIIVGRTDRPEICSLVQCYLPRAASEHLALRLPDADTRYAAIRKWTNFDSGVSDDPRGTAVSLDEVRELLAHYQAAHGKPARVALVLSGGAARCAYEMGAITAIEEMFGTLRKRSGDSSCDLGLVVGTSGGAINALITALGITSSEEGRTDVRDAWIRMDQREIIDPSPAVRWNMAIWFAALQIVMLGVIYQGQRRPWRRIFCRSLIFLGAIELVVALLPISPWRWLGSNHVLHHVWLWMTFGLKGAGGMLMLAGVIGFYRSKRHHLALPASRFIRLFLWILVAGLPIVQFVNILFFESTVSSGRGMETALARVFPQLLEGDLRRRGAAELKIDAKLSPNETLKTFSNEVIRRHLMTRDLAIASSLIEQSGSALPSDLYFWEEATSSVERPNYGLHGIHLGDYPAILGDVVLGSSAIFPMFPPRKIPDFPSTGGHIALVDGFFSHNSPVEAAVRWGATHIILIQASSPFTMEQGGFVTNMGTAVNHLYEQAQLLDVRARDDVSIFTLEPQPPQICLLDFAGPLLLETFDRGYRDAAGRGTSAARFVKAPGKPTFE